ncbi:MAG: hypothetical protein EKK47_13910 [Burkholderiales bacterium]|nr:MAG: hypothetical protein EKK47_13910 [Burkholderiales bacterium]
MSAVYPIKQGQSASWRFLSFLGRFVVFALVIAGALYRFSTPLAESLLPAIEAEFKWLDDTYDIKRLYVDQEGADHVVRVVVSQARCIVLIDRAFCGDPRGRANASTLIGNITLPAALLMSLVLAWPVIRSTELVWRAVFLPFGLAIVWALDVPFVLWSAIWSLHVDAFAPDMFSPLLIWTQFLQGGGRLALAILLGILITMGARWCAGISKRAMPEAVSS